MKPPPAPGLVNRLIALTLLLLVFTGTLGLGAVWMRQEISQTANQTRALEEKLTGVGRRLDEVNAEVAAAVNPNALLYQAKFMNLALVAPREIQVVRVSGSAELRLAAKRNREVFSLETASAESSNPHSPFRVVTASLR
jgi:hypothetical protein